MTIIVDQNGIGLDGGPLVAGESIVPVFVAVPIGDAEMRLIVSARFSGEILAVADNFTYANGGFNANLSLSTRAVALFMLTARADERRDVALELASPNQSHARATYPLRNSALVREAFPDLYPPPIV